MKSAYQICYPSGELTDKEIATAQFYMAIRSIIYKQTKGDAPDAEIMNAVVEEMVKEAITCTGIENIVDEHKSIDLFSDDFLDALSNVNLPITKFNALLKLLRKAITAYGRTNKVKAIEFNERLKEVVDAYNSRDKLVFTSEVVADFVNDLSDQLLKIMMISRLISPHLRKWVSLMKKRPSTTSLFRSVMTTDFHMRMKSALFSQRKSKNL
jgi:type I restriction enzyme R subunit